MMTAAGIETKRQKHVANAYRLIFHGQNSVFDSVLQINEQIPDGPEIRDIINFINATEKGIIGKM
jgi:UDP-N-acetylglucosamine acyltransferase